MYPALFSLAPGFALLVILARPLQSQNTPADTLHLSLSAVLTHVREEHPVWKGGQAKVLAARARASERSSIYNPKVSLSPDALSGVRVEVLQPIRWPWERSALKAVGVQDVAAASNDAETDRRAVLLDAAQRFADGLRTTQELILAVEAESLAQHTVDEIAPGNRPDSTANLAQLQSLVNLDEAHRAEVRAMVQHTISQSQLAAVLGLDPGKFIVFDGELTEIAPLIAPEAALATALATDPQSSRMEHEAERAGQEARVARARRWPALELGPAITVGENNRLGLALGIILPLWNRQRDAIRAARAERDTALTGIEVRHRVLSALVTEALLTLNRAETELKSLRGGALARAARAKLLAEKAAPQREEYVPAWIAAGKAFIEARSAELELEWEAAQARLLLRHLTGSLVMEEP